MKIALMFAGQGAQAVGMGKDLAEKFPVAAGMFRQADEILGRKLTDVMWNGPLEELTKTSNCQPALFVHGLACLAVLRELAGEIPVVAAAGLSLGEITAHASAGTFDFENGLKLVQRRGQLMDEACASTDGMMAALIGGDETAVRQLAAETVVDIANINSPGQIVISGERTKVELAVSKARDHGIRRATLLNVAGAYHSRLMQGASLSLGSELAKVEIRKPQFSVFSNVTGTVVTGPEEVRQTLRDQVIGTVRWVNCVEGMAGIGCDLFIELGPGGVLAGLVQRIRKGAAVLSAGDATALPACAEYLRLAA